MRIHGKNRKKMYFFSRYLPIGRSIPETTDSDNEIDAASPVRSSQTIEMVIVGRRVNQDLRSRSDSPRVEDTSPASSLNEEDFQEMFEEEGPSASVIVAVRLCVWSFFLFAFLILFQNQQEKFNSDRSRGPSRLRSPQLIHMQVPWTGYSGFRDHSTNLMSHYMESNSSTLSFSKLNSGQVSLTCRRLGSSQPITFTGDSHGISFEALHAVQPLSNGQMVPVTKLGDSFTFEFQSKKYEFGKSMDLVFFQLIPNTNSLLSILRSPTSQHTDCFNTYKLNTTSSALECGSSKPILRANAYFYDEAFSNLVSVGIDQWTHDAAGSNLHGIFVQSFQEAGAVDFSITLPFIHRTNDGMWAFQNSPLSNGFIIIVPTIGYPAQPVQHLVSIRPGIGDFPKGTVFRLESPELSLFRKVDTLKFEQPSLDASCAC